MADTIPKPEPPWRPADAYQGDAGDEYESNMPEGLALSLSVLRQIADDGFQHMMGFCQCEACRRIQAQYDGDDDRRLDALPKV